ncbi:MAG: DEAD/DEAH box helicase [Pirellulaceae bacterium]|nr:DEAD/DEAH box helicase [Pirellulaceae bacterium]
MANPLTQVSQNAFRFFAANVHPRAVRIQTPFPQTTPLAGCRLPAEVADFIQRYEPRTAAQGLFPHQAEFLSALFDERRQDFIITTATGSGKSLCFWSWVFEHLRRDPRATALLCFPTQALMWGQAKRLRRLSLPASLVQLGSGSSAYGGQVPMGQQTIGWTIWQGVGQGATYNAALGDYQKGRFFQQARIRIATLDKAHWSLYGSRDGKQFAARLKCFVLDEAHSYDGVFGANVHYFVKRMHLGCDLLGRSRPRMFLASATLNSAREFAATLLSLDAAEITHVEDHVRQEIDLVDTAEVPALLERPPSDSLLRVVLLVDDQAKNRGARDFMEDEAHLGAETNLIYFSQSKFASKLLARKLTLSGRQREVCIYDADLPPDDRRALEARLNAADSAGVTLLGTSALELGVDIEGLDVCLMDVTPPRRADLLQRIGRVGRRQGRPGLVILRLSAEPHDQEMLDEPVESFRLRNTRALPIPLHLEQVRWRHVLAAFQEWMGDLQYGAIAPEQFNESLRKHFGEVPKYNELVRAFGQRYGTLIDTEDRFWVYKGFRAAASEGKIPLKHERREVARIDELAVFRDAHPGAVFLGHDLRHYRVVAYEGSWKVAVAEQPDSDMALGKWLKTIGWIGVEPEPEEVTTRGMWDERFEFHENIPLAGGLQPPVKGVFLFGIWDYQRSWQGYTEIDLARGTSRKVSLEEATAEFARALETRKNAPFLHRYSYRTTGWQWEFGPMAFGEREEDELDALAELIAGLLNHFLAAAVESRLDDISVDFDVLESTLRVLDSPP